MIPYDPLLTPHLPLPPLPAPTTLRKTIYRQLAKLYPSATIWFTGHSLGGAIAALAALETGNAAVTFEAPGDQLYARRLGIGAGAVAGGPVGGGRMGGSKSGGGGKSGGGKSGAGSGEVSPPPPSPPPIWQFGSRSDPIFMGECKGALSACYHAGYAMETKCHVGYTCYLDVDVDDDNGKDGGASGDNGGNHNDNYNEKAAAVKIDIRAHRMSSVMASIQSPVTFAPACQRPSPECRDCEQWTFREPPASAARKRRNNG